MKYINYFKQYVELKTKVVSFFAFFIALFFYLNNYLDSNGVKVMNFIIFFIAMSCFDMATTALNHYTAFKTESEAQSEYDKRTLENMRILNISMLDNLKIIYGLIGLATILGLLLVYLSNIGVLLLGVLCFMIGIAYSYGPKPIAHTPFGEIFAGGTMGVVLPVIALFSQYDHLPFELDYRLVVVFMPLAFLIGSILFANNICDLDKDVTNKRYTLAYYTKQDLGATLLLVSNLFAILFIVLSCILGFLNYQYLILIIMIIPLSKNVLLFKQKYSKKESFPYIVKNYMLFSLAYLVALIVLR